MHPRYKEAFDALKLLGVPVYVHRDDYGNFSIDAETAGADEFVCCYADFDGWDCGVSPVVTDTLHHFGLFAEWINTGRLGVHQA